jgi:hypothetical protein
MNRMSIPYEKAMWKNTGEKATWRQRQRLEQCNYKLRNTNDCQQPPELGERNGMFSPSEPPEGANPDDILILDFWLPELEENKLLLFCVSKW